MTCYRPGIYSSNQGLYQDGRYQDVNRLQNHERDSGRFFLVSRYAEQLMLQDASSAHRNDSLNHRLCLHCQQSVQNK